jgi:hypothetical protein
MIGLLYAGYAISVACYPQELTDIQFRFVSIFTTASMILQYVSIQMSYVLSDS